MSAFLFLLAVLSLEAAPELPAPGVIEATIHGTSQPLGVILLRRDGDEWKEMDRRSLAPSIRAVRFDALAAGVYQVLIRGMSGTEQLATKLVIGQGDTRRADITVDPVILTGRVTFGGNPSGTGSVTLRNKDFQWHAAISVEPDGTFRAPLWQSGSYFFSVRSTTITTAYTGTIVLEGSSPIRFPIEIPDGRITGVVRDAKSGIPVSGASVALQTDSAGASQHVNSITNHAGRFDFNGLRFGRHTVTIVSAKHLEPSPVVFDLDAAKPARELDIPLDSGRTIAVMVRDADDHPVPNASLFAVSGGRRRSRVTTDENGSAMLAVPVKETASLFVVPDAGGFTTMQLAQEPRVTVRLPRAASSLRIRTSTTDGKAMPNFSLLMRYNGEVMPLEIADELSVVQGLQFATKESEAYLQNIPAGKYEFWSYRTKEEADSILAASSDVAPPIHVDVHGGENTIVVKFAAR
jgi:hypothetical protein